MPSDDGPLVSVGFLRVGGGGGFGKPSVDGNDVHSALVVYVKGASSDS